MIQSLAEQRSGSALRHGKKKKKKNKPRAEQEPRSAHGRAVKKINPVQSKNRARPMAARLKKNKPRAEQEPRSAHGRAVKNKK